MKKRENIIIIVVLVVMVLAIVGVSYAAFNYSRTGSINSITTGSITMTYEETDNTISLTGALPTTDKTGMVRMNPGEYFDFSISSQITGDVNINYEISAKDITVLSENQKKIDGKYIKLYLTKLNGDSEEGLMTPETYNEETTANDYTGRPEGEMSLYTSSMNSSESNNYRLRMYVTEEYNPQGDGGNLSFSVKINVYGKAGEKPLSAGEVVIENLISDSTYDDGVDTFITGTEPNNYIWYSGKLWRAVSVNNEAKTTKLVTEYNISALNYSSGSSNFDSSYIKDWLNDTSVDGFLGNLRNYRNFIVADAKWDATMDDRELGSITRPSGKTTTIVPVGLLNLYEYQSSYNGTTRENSYLNNGYYSWALTPASATEVWVLNDWSLDKYNASLFYGSGVRPAINLKANVEIVSGDGTENNPYRLKGDNDTNLEGTLLNTRYSGEYVKFGETTHDLYQIVSHESTGLTKIVSMDVLRDSSNEDIYLAFDSSGNVNYSPSTTIGNFLNGEYLSNYVGSTYSNMIADNSTWYLGTVSDGQSYKLAKYIDVNGTVTTSNTINAKVGLLRMGELMSGQSYYYDDYSTNYWLLTIYNATRVAFVYGFGDIDYQPVTDDFGIRPSLNLKSNVVITEGDGTIQNPFVLSVQ